MKAMHKAVVLGLTVGILFWVLDTVLDFLVLHEGAFLDNLILNVSFHEAYMRLSVLFMFLLVALVVGKYISNVNESKEKLQALSKHTDAILAAVPDIIMEVDVNKVYTWANEMGLEFFGEDVLGKEASCYFEGDQQTYHAVEPLFEGDDSVVYVESWQRRRDGEKRLLAWWCRVLKDRQGNVKGALSTARDITEHKRLEENLHNSVELIYEAERLANLGYYELSWGTGEGFWSEGFYLLTGYEPGEIPSSSEAFLSLVHTSDRKVVSKALDQSRLSKHPYDEEFRIIRKDGEIRIVRAIGRFIYGEGHRAVLCRGICKDITEHKRAEQAVQQSEKRLLKAQRLAKMGFMDWNLKTNEMYWCVRMYWLYGIDRKLKPSLELSMDLVHPDDREQVRRTIDLAVRGLKKYNIQYRRVQPSGRVVWVHDRGELSRDEAGNPERLLVSTLDITKLKKAEEITERLARFPMENPSPVLCVASDGQVLYGNKASSELMKQWGSEVGETVPADWCAIVREGLESGSNRFKECRIGGREYAFEFVPIIPSGYVNLYGTDVSERGDREE